MVKKIKKFRIEKHYICTKCGGCYFGEKDSAIACYDNNDENGQ